MTTQQLREQHPELFLEVLKLGAEAQSISVYPFNTLKEYDQIINSYQEEYQVPLDESQFLPF